MHSVISVLLMLTLHKEVLQLLDSLQHTNIQYMHTENKTAHMPYDQLHRSYAFSSKAAVLVAKRLLPASD